MLTGKMGVQPILPIAVIKGAARQCYSDSDEYVRCEWALGDAP